MPQNAGWEREDSELAVSGSPNKTLWIGCLFCRSGAEDALISDLKRSAPSLEAISPKKIRIRRMGSEAKEEIVTLFPGYIFFRTASVPDFRSLLRNERVYRLLTYPSGGWELQGGDRALAERLFERGGVIGLSKAFYDGDRVRIVEGQLKDHEGSILRLNRRAKTAQVCVDLLGKRLTLWLGYEIIEH